MTALTTDTVASIDDGRMRLDSIDDQLIALLVARRDVSTQIQELRMRAGGSRIEHARENAVIRHWVDALGDSGAELALAVLAHCRGRR